VKKQQMKIEVARNANQTAWNSLFEAITLHDIAESVARNHDGECAQVDSQIHVLNSAIGERIGNALDGIDMVCEYFGRVKKKEPKVRNKRIKNPDLSLTTSSRVA
jgi:hypothetical protein